MTIEPIYRCPFCSLHSTTGLIAVDFDALLWMSPAKAADPVRETIEWAPDSSRRVFIFNPDGVPNRPCPHVVSFMLHANITMQRRDGEIEWPVAHSISWDHPWLDANDRDKELEKFLWTEIDLGSPEPAFYPSTRYEIDPVRLARRVPRSRRKLEIGGTVIVAVDAQRFLEELRDGVGRLRDYDRRARTGGSSE